MDRKRLIYIAVLALSCGGFLVDRLFLSEPESASAASPGIEVPMRAPRAKPVPKDGAESSSEGDPLFGWLDRIPPASQPRDVFALSGAFASEPTPESPAEETKAAMRQDEVDQLVAEFGAKHKLQTTLVTGQQSLAAVDGQVLRVGELLDDFCLIKVDLDRATFRHEASGAVVSLVLEFPP